MQKSRRSSERRDRHELSDGGRLFFETDEALVPSDTNGQRDVYEYENGQRVSDLERHELLRIDPDGASESGDDVFFRSTQQLVPQDNAGRTARIYDARVDGGFPAVLAAAVHDRRRVPRAGLAAAVDLWGAVEPDVLRAGNLAPPRSRRR